MATLEDVIGWCVHVSEDEEKALLTELARLRAYAAQAKANEADAERWRKVVEIINKYEDGPTVMTPSTAFYEICQI